MQHLHLGKARSKTVFGFCFLSGKHSFYPQWFRTKCVRNNLNLLLIFLLLILSIWCFEIKRSIAGHNPYNMLFFMKDYRKNFTTRLQVTINKTMAMFVVKSIVIQINGKCKNYFICQGNKYFFNFSLNLKPS